MAPGLRTLGVLATSAFLADAQLPTALEAALQETAEVVSKQWNCSVSIAFKSAAGEAAAAHGVVDFSTGKQAEVTDPYAWGSVTKVLTGASILRLVSEGKFGLDDEVAPLVDPILARMAKANPNQGFASMSELWGQENVAGTTIRQLLGMKAGVPDFDTANPCMPTQKSCVPKDSLRALLYANPEHGYAPEELMNVSWVAHQWTPCKKRFLLPQFCYSSTNFMLLGLILADQAGASSWLDFDQGEFLPPSLQGRFNFSKTGAPKDFTHVHGYDRTAYNMPAGQFNDHDNWAVKGVFSGWSASDIVGSSMDVARLGWEVYGPPNSIAPKSYVDLMAPSAGPLSIYGLATHNLGRNTGHSGSLGRAYGHLGATYGYQSIVAFLPAVNATISVATNIETDNQQQPAHALCLSYNKVLALLTGQTFQCTFTPSGYYASGCKCNSAEETSAEVVV